VQYQGTHVRTGGAALEAAVQEAVTTAPVVVRSSIASQVQM
jgi:hypothetical protein